VRVGIRCGASRAEAFWGATVQQSPGAFLYSSNTGSSVIRWWEPPCTFSGLTPPEGARLEVAVPSDATCREWVRDVGYVFFPIFVDYPYLLWTDVVPTSPLRPFDPLTDDADYTVVPPDPGATAVENALDVLDEDGNDVLRDQIDWALTPGAQEDEEPIRVGTGISEEDRACKAHFGEPESGEDPGRRSPNAPREAADWDYDVDVFPGVYNPYARAAQTVKLRWGTRAWGYRHIEERHGWGAGARTRTAYALLDPTPQAQSRYPQSFVYFGNLVNGPNGIDCRQRVVVSYDQDQRVPVGRHIITSYLEAY